VSICKTGLARPIGVNMVFNAVAEFLLNINVVLEMEFLRDVMRIVIIALVE